MHDIETTPRRVIHAKEYQAYLASGRSLTDVARAFSKARNTVLKWRDEEDWDMHADAAVDRLAKGVATELADQGALALESAKTLAKESLATARYLMAKLAQHATGDMADSGDIRAAFAAADVAVNINDKLYGWSRIKIEHSGTIKHEATDPADVERRLIERGVIRPEDAVFTLARA